MKFVTTELSPNQIRWIRAWMYLPNIVLVAFEFYFIFAGRLAGLIPALVLGIVLLVATRRFEVRQPISAKTLDDLKKIASPGYSGLMGGLMFAVPIGLVSKSVLLAVGTYVFYIVGGCIWAGPALVIGDWLRRCFGVQTKQAASVLIDFDGK